MPTCCVPGCNSGYRNAPCTSTSNISFHAFPVNPDLRSKWLRNIPRENFTPTTSSKVCSLHFCSVDFLEFRSDSNNSRAIQKSSLIVRRLQKTAVPSLFSNLPSYLSSPPPIPRSTSATAESRIRRYNDNVTQQVEEFYSDDVINTLDDLVEKFSSAPNKPSNYTVCRQSDSVCFISLDTSSTPSIISCVNIHRTLSYTVHHSSVYLNNQEFSSFMQHWQTIHSFTDFLNLLAHLNSRESSINIQQVLSLLSQYIEVSKDLSVNQRCSYEFLSEQISLVETHKNGRRFTTSTLVNAVLWQSYSTSCYQAILDSKMLALPSSSSLRRLTKSFQPNDNTMLSYLQIRRSKLNEYEARVSLAFDEVYIYQKPEFQHSRFTGLTDDGKSVASTVLVFLIKSLSSKYCDVVLMCPIASLKTDQLAEKFLIALKLVTEAGFDVVSTVADNLPTNFAFFKNTLCKGTLCSKIEHPYRSGQSLFLLSDPTHVIKNIYNNFQRSSQFSFKSDGHIYIAKFSDVKALFELEKGQPIKMAFKLSPTVIKPSNIQRCSVRLASALFSESTINAFQFYVNHDHQNWNGTCRFLKLIHDLWRIINVKTSDIGRNKRDPYREPVVSIDDWKLTKLEEYFEFFSEWQTSGRPGLSSQTFSATILMCSSLKMIATYLIQSAGFSFVLLGHLQSDPLERRFGRYRQMAGSNCFISYRNVIESERKIKIHSLLKHSALTISDLQHISPLLPDDNIEESPHTSSIISELQQCIDPETVVLTDNETNVIYYVAGYICHSLSNCISCQSCIFLLSSQSTCPPPETKHHSEFLEMVNRGGLKCPSNLLFTHCCITYQYLFAIKSSPLFHSFASSVNPLYLLSKIRPSQTVLSCESGHSLLSIFRRVDKSLFNIFGKNYT
jgi:hypothetical protein